MIVVIIAGGSGTRLWPLSTPDYPKHLLALNGDGSLLQNTYDRAKKMSDKLYVITDCSHDQHVKDQLPDLPDDHLIIEPARRGTASCVVAGLERVARDNPNDEPIAFIAADHYVRDTEGFIHSFRVAEKVAKSSKRIVLVGAEPTYPATGFGYIEKGEVFDDQNFVFKVSQFKEKPEYDVAKKYFKSGNYLWNCGYFVATGQTFLKAMEQNAPQLFGEFNKLKASSSSKDYQAAYLDFQNIAIDYALIEKTKDLLVVPAAFDWMDLGSYGDLHKAAESDQKGNHTYGQNIELEDVENSYIRNDDGRPVAVIGLDNVAVVNTPNGVLVTRKDLAQKVGEISKRIQAKKDSQK